VNQQIIWYISTPKSQFYYIVLKEAPKFQKSIELLLLFSKHAVHFILQNK